MILGRTIRKFRRKLAVKGSLYDFGYDEQLRHFSNCFAFINGNRIQGDILEFGVFRGRSLIFFDNLIKRVWRPELRNSYRMFGFDSFLGLPEPAENGADHPDFTKGMYSCSKEEVHSMLREAKVDLDKIQLVEGYYSESLKPELMEQFSIKRASLINIDCDLYESTLAALQWCEPVISQGTIINFDDWFCYEGREDNGEQRAFNEFLEQNPHLTAKPFSTYSWHGKAFVMGRDLK